MLFSSLLLWTLVLQTFAHINSTSPSMAAWTTDGSEHLAAAGAAVTCVLDAPGSKANALYSGGSGLYALTMSGAPGAWVGVCTPAGFGAGWRVKGLFYGGPGNLADGGGLLASGWGPSLAAGDVLHMRLEQAEGHVTLAFALNGAPLGVAFDIIGWRGGELHPAVSLSEAGQGVALARVAGALPPLADFVRAPPAGLGLEGQWRGRYSLKVASAGPGAWHLAVRVHMGNSMSCRVEQGAGGALRIVGGISSTLMAPPPEAEALEREAMGMLQGITGLRREGAGLVLAGGGSEERFAPAPGPAPVGREQVHWMN